MSVPGVVTVEVNGEKVRMTYNKSAFTPTVETIRLDDPRLSNVWGEQVCRISLNANKQLLSGSYTYTITTINNWYMMKNLIAFAFSAFLLSCVGAPKTEEKVLLTRISILPVHK